MPNKRFGLLRPLDKLSQLMAVEPDSSGERKDGHRVSRKPRDAGHGRSPSREGSGPSPKEKRKPR